MTSDGKKIKVKGRGALRFRGGFEEEREKTPPHWKREQVRYLYSTLLLSMTSFSNRPSTVFSARVVWSLINFKFFLFSSV